VSVYCIASLSVSLLEFSHINSLSFCHFFDNATDFDSFDKGSPYDCIIFSPKQKDRRK